MGVTPSLFVVPAKAGTHSPRLLPTCAASRPFA